MEYLLYTPNDNFLNSLLNILILFKTYFLVLFGQAHVDNLHRVSYSDIYIPENKYLLKEQRKELG